MIALGGPTYGAGSWTTFTPSGVIATSGTLTTVGTVSGRYKQIDKTVLLQMRLDITTNGSGAGSIQVNLPLGPASAPFIVAGRERIVTGKMLFGFIGSGQSVMPIAFYDNTYPGADGASLVITGLYEIQ